MSDPVGRRRMDTGLVRLAGRVELLLGLVAVALAWEAFTGPGLSRLLSGAGAVVLVLMLALARARGTPLEKPLQVLGALAGLTLSLGGVGIMALGVWFLTLGSFALLMGLVLVPVGLAVGAWGYGLLGVALAGRGPSREVDLEAARRSEAVRRFDALHRPSGARPAEASGQDVDGDAP